MLFIHDFYKVFQFLIRVKDGTLLPVELRLINCIFEVHVVGVLRLIIRVNRLALGRDIKRTFDALLTT